MKRKRPATKRVRPPGAGKRGPIPGEGGGPRKMLTPDQLEQVERMAEIGCTRAEMANRLVIDEDTLAARIRDTPSVSQAVKRGDANLRTSLRRKQVQIALKDGHPAQATMLVWCGKTILGQSERTVVKIESEADALTKLRELYPELTDAEILSLAGIEAPPATPSPDVH